jgi:hypothetical protein
MKLFEPKLNLQLYVPDLEDKLIKRIRVLEDEIWEMKNPPIEKGKLVKFDVVIDGECKTLKGNVMSSELGKQYFPGLHRYWLYRIVDKSYTEHYASDRHHGVKQMKK